MKRTIIFTLTFILFASGLIYLFTYTPELSDKHGVVDSKLYLGNSKKQPLIVAFGGGGGGNDWIRNYLKGKRDTLNQMGYAVLAVGYFNAYETQQYLDRISLDAIRDTIISVASHPKIDAERIILLGGSRGGELALNLASRFDDIKGVIALSTSNVSFPAITWSANTSSWMYKNKEVPYVPAPFKTILPAIKGDLYTAHSMILEDKKAVKNAEIQVENINGPILVLSGKLDKEWPAPEMSDQIISRLQKNNFNYYYSHIMLDGGHTAPLNHFDLVYSFLEEHFPTHQNKNP
ncbi:alpha/beta hydrolase family protein [Marinigracilibium pacificum]|uniref:Alpha/beta hydrolase n=1 Tax=Marinigracilibium pacificum TaxID=2729599 RepID=A0A848J5C3_9BACT|nr:acyl-CoA thioester hydrolase/BAAT C-terminal domain-containing protein [Marinigracilibium pacificum]NMM50675.1 alpha/beta hydrolase [Marinigracilibium pacificum]